MSDTTRRASTPMALTTFSASLAALGILALVSGDFALQWQPVPPALPQRALLAYVTGVVELILAAALSIPKTRAVAARGLVVFTIAWVALLKIPIVVAAPRAEVSWLGLGEIAIVVAAALSLMVGRGYRRTGRIVFALALIPVGLSHIVYAKTTAGFIPHWIPFALGWAYFTGVAHIAAGLAVLFDVLAVLGATLEAVMLGMFAVLVWIPVVARTPAARLPWTALIITWVIAAAAWVVASELEQSGSAPRLDGLGRAFGPRAGALDRFRGR